MVELVKLVGGEEILAHTKDKCEGRACAVHNPSDHRMRAFPQHWRDDRALMERICPHGIGHPDPDHMAWYRTQRTVKDAYYESIHGCCGAGCCG